jgi:hypothetical protein
MIIELMEELVPACLRPSRLACFARRARATASLYLMGQPAIN